MSAIKGLTITLTRDIDEDYIGHLVNAIQMHKGVLKVEPIEADNSIEFNRVSNAGRKVVFDLAREFDKRLESKLNE